MIFFCSSPFFHLIPSPLPSISPLSPSPPSRPGIDNPFFVPFLDIRTWFANVEQHATEGVNKILIGNKCDWEEKRAVSTEQGQALADELGIPFLEVSAKSNINIDKAFYNLAADIKERITDTQKHEQAPTVSVGDQGNAGLGGKCC